MPLNSIGKLRADGCRLIPSSLLFLFLILVLGTCAGAPRLENKSRYIADSFGFAHAGIRGRADRDMLALMGADLVRQDISWSEAQPVPGPFDFTFFDERMDAADAAGVSMVGLLVYDTPWIHDNPEGLRQVDPEDIPHWIKYVEAAAERYADQAAAFEVWNEPNFNRFWTGSEEDFFTLTKAAVDTLNRVAPDTTVIVGSLILHPVRSGIPFLRRFLASGAAEGADALSVHCYGISPEITARRLKKARALMDEYGFEGELWITEVGLPTGGRYPYAAEPERQGAVTAKWLASVYANGADRVIWYELYDDRRPHELPPNASSENFFGVAYHDYELKTGGEVMRRLVPDITGSRWAPDLIAGGFRLRGPAVHAFETAPGRAVVVAWSRFGRFDAQLTGFPQGAEIFNTLTGEERFLQPGDRLELPPEPIIIKGRTVGSIGFAR